MKRIYNLIATDTAKGSDLSRSIFAQGNLRERSSLEDTHFFIARGEISCPERGKVKKCICVCKSGSHPRPRQSESLGGRLLSPPCVSHVHPGVSFTGLGQTTGHAPFLHDRHPDIWRWLIEVSPLHFLGLGLCQLTSKSLMVQRGAFDTPVSVSEAPALALPLSKAALIPSPLGVQAVSGHSPRSGDCKTTCP